MRMKERGGVSATRDMTEPWTVITVLMGELLRSGINDTNRWIRGPLRRTWASVVYTTSFQPIVNGFCAGQEVPVGGARNFGEVCTFSDLSVHLGL